MKLTKSTIRHGVIAGTLFSVAALAAGIVAYQVAMQGAHLTAQVSVLVEQQAQEETYYKLQKIAEASEAERQSLDALFLTRESDSIDLLSQVETIAPTVGIALETKALSVITEEDERDWIQATFAFSGEREQVYDFVTLLETMPYVLRLTAVDLKERSGEGWSGEVVLQVRIAYDE